MSITTHATLGPGLSGPGYGTKTCTEKYGCGPCPFRKMKTSSLAPFALTTQPPAVVGWHVAAVLLCSGGRVDSIRIRCEDSSCSPVVSQDEGALGDPSLRTCGMGASRVRHLVWTPEYVNPTPG